MLFFTVLLICFINPVTKGILPALAEFDSTQAHNIPVGFHLREGKSDKIHSGWGAGSGSSFSISSGRGTQESYGKDSDKSYSELGIKGQQNHGTHEISHHGHSSKPSDGKPIKGHSKPSYKDHRKSEDKGIITILKDDITSGVAKVGKKVENLVNDLKPLPKKSDKPSYGKPTKGHSKPGKSHSSRPHKSSYKDHRKSEDAGIITNLEDDITSGVTNVKDGITTGVAKVGKKVKNLVNSLNPLATKSDKDVHRKPNHGKGNSKLSQIGHGSHSKPSYGKPTKGHSKPGKSHSSRPHKSSYKDHRKSEDAGIITNLEDDITTGVTNIKNGIASGVTNVKDGITTGVAKVGKKVKNLVNSLNPLATKSDKDIHRKPNHGRENSKLSQIGHGSHSKPSYGKPTKGHSKPSKSDSSGPHKSSSKDDGKSKAEGIITILKDGIKSGIAIVGKKVKELANDSKPTPKKHLGHSLDISFSGNQGNKGHLLKKGIKNAHSQSAKGHLNIGLDKSRSVKGGTNGESNTKIELSGSLSGKKNSDFSQSRSNSHSVKLLGNSIHHHNPAERYKREAKLENKPANKNDNYANGKEEYPDIGAQIKSATDYLADKAKKFLVSIPKAANKFYENLKHWISSYNENENENLRYQDKNKKNKKKN